MNLENLTPEKTAWGNLIARCLRPSHQSYHHYGGRGIKVCQEWVNSYNTFLKDVGRRPSSKHSLDRIDNNGNYEPSNVRWVDQKTQCNNTRKNVFLTHNSKTQTAVQWAEELSLKSNTIVCRKLNGWSDAESLGFESRPKKLSIDDIKLICDLKGIKSSRVIAKTFNVSHPTIHNIWNRNAI